MKSVTISQHKKLIVIACVACVVLVALYAYMYYSVNIATERAVAAKVLIQEHTFSDANANKIKKLYQTTEKQRADILKHVIPSNKMLTFIETLEAVGDEAGSTLTLSAVSGSKMSDTVPTGMELFHAHANVSGSWSSVMQTLMLAEALPFVTVLDSVQLDTSATAGTKNTHRWQASFDITMLASLATSTPQK